MIINIKNKKDLITLDLRTNQIRYLNDFENRGLIEFIDLGYSDSEAYEYLFNEDKDLFFKSLQEDIFNFLEKEVNIKDLVIAR